MFVAYFAAWNTWCDLDDAWLRSHVSPQQQQINANKNRRDDLRQTADHMTTAPNLCSENTPPLMMWKTPAKYRFCCSHGCEKTILNFPRRWKTHMLHTLGFPRLWKITCFLYQIFHNCGKTHVAYIRFSTVVENYLLFVLDFPRWWKITCCLYWIFHGGGKTHAVYFGCSTCCILDFPRLWKMQGWYFPLSWKMQTWKRLKTNHSYMDTGGRLLGSVRDLDHVFIALKLPLKLRRRF